MLPQRSVGHRRSHYRTAIDAKLMEKTGFDEVTLRRIRKSFMQQFTRLIYNERKSLEDGGTGVRFAFMNGVLHRDLNTDLWQSWLRYLEHTEQDVADMMQGEYPISPYLIRVYSALFGIKVDFLLLGVTPAVDKNGANIDVWPLAGTR